MIPGPVVHPLEWSSVRHHAASSKSGTRSPPAHLEGLVPHEYVSIQGEAELPFLKEARVGLGVLVVYPRQRTASSAIGSVWGGGWRLRNCGALTVSVDQPLVHVLMGEQPSCCEGAEAA